MTDQGSKILVVDDVPENRDLLVRRLQRLGFSAIDQAENGLRALEAIRSRSYDLVLLDIMMPELDGFGVLAALKEEGRINDLPVIVISALNEIEPVVRCIEFGADDFIFKPFNPILLRARVLATLEKKTMRDRTREELRRKQLELNEARTLQLALVPDCFSGEVSGRSLSIDVLLEPAKEVGGDLVDHFQVGDGLIVLALGDVSEKGAGSALMMARTHAMFRALAGRPDAAELFQAPERAVSLVNTTLATGNASLMFVTFLLATFDVTSGKLTYVRAGHIQPYHRNGSSEVARLEAFNGPPLGIDESAEYTSDTVTLAPGDRLLVVTDGFTEAQDAAGVLYGEDRVGAFMGALKPSDRNTLQALRDDVRSFEAGAPPFDDMAAILLSLRPSIGSPFEIDTLATTEGISVMTDKIFAYLGDQRVDARAAHHVALVLEELVTNLGMHGNCCDKPARIRLAVELKQVTGEIMDTGPTFDPNSASDPDIDAPMADRRIGGLGLYLVRQLTASLGYSHRDGENLTTFSVSRA
jgi:sigma-B regulation protein RsbU (phosphoserine phosphatase)